jgi:hypothetical protein
VNPRQAVSDVDAVVSMHEHALRMTFELGLSIQAQAGRLELSSALRFQVDELVRALDEAANAILRGGLTLHQLVESHQATPARSTPSVLSPSAASR